MPKYILEEDINFYEELNKKEEEDYENICLITKEPLESINIKLPCSHSFNYIPIFNEIVKQKKIDQGNNLEVCKLDFNQIKCPYCRGIHNNILPYIKHPKVRRIKGVNWPEEYSMESVKCEKCNELEVKENAVEIIDGKNVCYQHMKKMKKQSKKVKKEKVEKKCCEAILKGGKNKGKQCGVKIGMEEIFCASHIKTNQIL